MDVKRNNAPANTVTRDIEKFTAPTGNIYESVMVIAKRANQISAELKQELSKKLEEFASVSDNLEEVFENREQIEMSKYYEKLPKAGLLAVQEFLEDKIYFRKAESNK
ncbi:MAG: DNA-directed RNA polymerase subunit omega [Prevotellaceae bacterium]|jgi:DNA-directed RNA polymerase subunit K/omega|nr:DNA-directed RNA polymerase subunit omega [Prevotellaceae bacterium]